MGKQGGARLLPEIIREKCKGLHFCGEDAATCSPVELTSVRLSCRFTNISHNFSTSVLVPARQNRYTGRVESLR